MDTHSLLDLNKDFKEFNKHGKIEREIKKGEKEKGKKKHKLKQFQMEQQIERLPMIYQEVNSNSLVNTRIPELPALKNSVSSISRDLENRKVS